METKFSILLADADNNVRTLTVNALKKSGYLVEKAENGRDALELAMNSHFDMVISDVDLPYENGLDILRSLREADKHMPWIFLTNRTAEEDIIAGLNAGADVYMSKPFSMDILLAQVNALLRRSGQQETVEQVIYQLGEQTFDIVRQTLDDIHLSSRETELLTLLCRHRNHVVDRSMILKSIWSVDNYFTARSLAVYINHLRKYLATNPYVKIMGVHGKGYKLVDQE